MNPMTTRAENGPGRIAHVRRSWSLLCDPELFLNLFQRHTLRLRNHCLHPNELQHHHPGKKREHISGRKGGDHLRKESCEQGGENPVRETAEGLTFRAMTVGKYFRDEYPNDRSLADRVRRDECE